MKNKEKIAEQINELLKVYYQKTMEIKKFLPQMDEAYFTESLHKMVDDRDQVIQKLKHLQETSGLSSLGDAGVEPELANKIYALEKEITSELETFKSEQGKQIKQINQGKLTYNAYSGYIPSTGGAFFDKKK